MDRRDDVRPSRGEPVGAFVRHPEPDLAERDDDRASHLVEPTRRLLDGLAVGHASISTISATTSSTDAARRVERDRVLRLDERPVGPSLVARIALCDRRRDLLVAQVGDLLVPPLRPHLGVGGQVHLELGVGEDDRPDVATFDDAAASRLSPRALTPAHLGAHVGVRGDDAHGAGHLGPPDLDARVDAVDEHTLLADVELDVVRDPGDRGVLARVDAAPERGERDSPVHRTGVEVLEAESSWPGPSQRSTCRLPPGRRWRSRASERDPTRPLRGARQGGSSSRGRSSRRSRDR